MVAGRGREEPHYSGPDAGFGFVPPPAELFAILAAMVVAYLTLVGAVKRRFCRQRLRHPRHRG